MEQAIIMPREKILKCRSCQHPIVKAIEVPLDGTLCGREEIIGPYGNCPKCGGRFFFEGRGDSIFGMSGSFRGSNVIFSKIGNSDVEFEGGNFSR